MFSISTEMEENFNQEKTSNHVSQLEFLNKCVRQNGGYSGHMLLTDTLCQRKNQSQDQDC